MDFSLVGAVLGTAVYELAWQLESEAQRFEEGVEQVCAYIRQVVVVVVAVGATTDLRPTWCCP